jgi:hypothetical protein
MANPRRTAALIVTVPLILAAIGWMAIDAIGGDRSPGQELCHALVTDLDHAVTGTRPLPNVSDIDPLQLGLCSTKTTRRYETHLPGVDEHRQHTVAGRITTDINFVGGLRHAKAAVKSDATTVEPLPQLGPDAFVVTETAPRQRQTRLADGTAQPVGIPNDATGGIPLPATAYWIHHGMAFTVSGTRTGATVGESKRITTRLAELINRRPVAKR